MGPTPTTPTYVTAIFIPGMGLGNQMFVYAIMYGVARMNNKVPVMEAATLPPFLKQFPTTTLARTFDADFVNFTEVHVLRLLLCAQRSFSRGSTTLR